MNKNICQSCGMKMVVKQLDRRGSNKDGTRSDKYCNYCYLNGKFQDESLTQEKMIEITFKAIDESNSSKLVKKMYKWMYPKQLKNLERWK